MAFALVQASHGGPHPYLNRCLLTRQHNPSFLSRDRRAFFDPNLLAHLALVALVMGVIVFGPANRLLEQGMREATLDLDHDGLVVLVADHDPKQNAFWHRLYLYALAAALFARAAVLMRAMSRLICLTRAVFSSWPEAAWKRRLNFSFFSLTSSSPS